MEDSNSLSQQQQQRLLLQQQQQKQQQQLYLLQQFQQQRQQQQQQTMARFPSNIDAHLRPLGSIRPSNLNSLNQLQNPNPNPNPNLNSLHQLQNPSAQKMNRGPSQSQPGGNQAEIQMAYQDAWRVCHPDFKRPFTSLEDACERLLPYHVVADYEAEEDDKILESDTTGQALSRSQQWDHNILAKIAEFTSTFEKQALAFNIITRKRALGEFRSEERLMLEQALLQEEKHAVMELRAEIEQRAGREAQEAKLRMAAMQAEQARAEYQAHSELMAQGPIRVNAIGSHGNDEMGEPEQGMNPDEMMNGWGNNQRVEREPSDDFLNDEEAENGDTGMQEDFDLNSSR